MTISVLKELSSHSSIHGHDFDLFNRIQVCQMQTLASLLSEYTRKQYLKSSYNGIGCITFIPQTMK